MEEAPYQIIVGLFEEKNKAFPSQTVPGEAIVCMYKLLWLCVEPMCGILGLWKITLFTKAPFYSSSALLAAAPPLGYDEVIFATSSFILCVVFLQAADAFLQATILLYTDRDLAKNKSRMIGLITK